MEPGPLEREGGGHAFGGEEARGRREPTDTGGEATAAQGGATSAGKGEAAAEEGLGRSLEQHPRPGTPCSEIVIAGRHEAAIPGCHEATCRADVVDRFDLQQNGSRNGHRRIAEPIRDTPRTAAAVAPCRFAPAVSVLRITIPRASGVATAREHVPDRSEEHMSELQSLRHLVCRLLLEKKK